MQCFTGSLSRSKAHGKSKPECGVSEMNSINSSKAIQRVLLSLTGLILLAAPVFAAEEQSSVPAPKEAEEVVKTGIIAVSANVGSRGPFGIETKGAAPGDEQSVITGGISRTGKDTCAVTVTNKSEQNSYSVSLSVLGYDQRGTRRLTRSFSARLAPKGTETKQVKCQNYNVEVMLKSATKIKK